VADVRVEGRRGFLGLPIGKERKTPVVEMKLELVPVPVSDVDRAKAFYVEKVGFNVDLDHQVTDEVRIVQLTPPGSACSIMFGTGVVKTAPGCVENLHLVVSDVNAARSQLVERGVDVSEVETYGGDEGRAVDDPEQAEFLRDKPPVSYATSRIPMGTAGLSSNCRTRPWAMRNPDPGVGRLCRRRSVGRAWACLAVRSVG
jgi:predicted enzyme related to lactoylglutathione lyase